MRFTVSTIDLRRALISVTPHAEPDPDLAQLHRVRLHVAGENVTVSATNRYSSGHALVSVWDNQDGELGEFDLSPTDVKELLALFRGKSAEDGPGDTLGLDVTDEHVTITDVSGLFDGKQLKLPRYAMEDNFPDVASLVARRLTAPREGAARLITNGRLLALFTKAASAYGEQLVIDPSSDDTPMIITCGESFLGALMPVRPDEETTARIFAWHTAWLSRIDERVPTGSTS